MPDERVELEENTGGAVHRADSQQAHVNKVERLRSNGDSSLMGVKVHKVCCVCGTLLNHRPRFKDAKGRYWCASCNDADHEKNRPMPCADCGVEMARPDLKEVSGVLLCPVCVTKCANESKSMAQVRLQALAHNSQLPAGHKKKVAAEKDPFPWQTLLIAVVLVLAAVALLLLVK